jgi:cytochrome c oxidase subunit 2
MGKLLNLPIEASQHAADIDRMTILTHWLMLVLFVGWGIYFIYVLFRFRAGRNPRANYQGVKSHTSSYIEIGVAVTEAVLLIAFAIPAWASRVNQFPSEQDATTVRVTGKQFEWHVQYPGADGRFGRRDIKLITPGNPLGVDRSDPAAKDDLTTINQLNLPVNKPVLVHLSTQDVIHSFGLLEMRVKQDAIPGAEIPVWFVPTRVGQYEIACSQLCGLGHYRMRGFVSIQTAEDFQKWQQEEMAALAEQTGN